MPQPRELTDRYRLEKILGSSRGGTVLRATDTQTGRAVAVKLITIAGVADPERAKAFSRFAGELAALRHPSLPAVLDSGFTTDGSAFLVLELLSGAAFETLGGQGPERILPLLGQALDGLEALAGRGLCHLNLTPANLLVTSTGEERRNDASAQSGAPLSSEQVKLLGLGSAVFRFPEPAAAGAAAALAADSEAARCQAPELAGSAGAPDWRADLFSLAVTACQALGATIVFGEGEGATVQMPLALSFDLANDEALRRILERCLRQLPAERPSHREVRDAFRLALGEAVKPEPPPAGESTWPGVGRPAGWPAAPAPRRQTTGPLQATLSGLRPPDLPDLDETLWRPAAEDLADLQDLDPTLLDPPRHAAPSSLSGAHPAASAEAEPEDQLPIDLGDRLEAERGDPSPANLSPIDLGDYFAALPRDAFAGLGDHAEGFDLAAPSPSDLESPLPALEPPPPLIPPVPANTVPSADAGPAAAGVPGSPSPRADALPALDPPRRPSALPAELAASAAQVLAALSGEPVPGLAPPAPPSAARGTAARAAAAAPSGAAVPPSAAVAAPPARGAAAFAAAPATASAAAAGVSIAPGASGAPSVAAPRAPGAGDLLSLDEALLGALPPAASAPAAAPAGTADKRRKPWGARGAAPQTVFQGAQRAPAPAATAAAAARPATETSPAGAGLLDRLGPVGRLPHPVLLGVAAGGLLVAVLAAYLLLRLLGVVGSGAAGGGSGDSAGASFLTAPAPPVESARAKLALAKSYLGEGRSGDAQVKAALASLTFAEQAALPPGGCDEVGALQQTLNMVARETVPADLAAGLRSGDLALLEGVVAVGSELDVPPAMKADFARATSLVSLYQQAGAAARRGDNVGVLQRFQSLEGLQRNLRDPQELRAHAAAALESEAAALGRDGKYAEALARLEVVHRAWPERSGIKDLVRSSEQNARDEERQQAILEGLPNFERRRKPSEGLDLLRDVKPTPHLAAQLAAAKKRLEDQLAQLDAQPPRVVLRDGYLLDYSRGTVVTLSFRATDDYQVRSVKMMARPPGGRMREMPLQRSGLGYTVDIPPSFHQNGTVEFYVVATDLSGHEGYLGTPDKPLQLKRRQGFERMLR